MIIQSIYILLLYISQSILGKSAERHSKSLHPMEINLPYSDLRIATSPFFNYRMANPYRNDVSPYQQQPQLSPRIFWGNLLGNDPNRVVKMNDLTDIKNKQTQFQKDINGINSRITSLHIKSCPGGTTQVGNECFTLERRNAIMWATANAICGQKGGYLAVPSLTENTFNAIMNPGAARFWIGAQETNAGTNVFVWLDGNVVAPLPAGAPVVPPECVHATGAGGPIAALTRALCTATTVNAFLCEYDKILP